jgi:RimJ/RimL family protein N-acetyltransferase
VFNERMTDTRQPNAAPPSAPLLDGHGLRLRLWDPESAADAEAWLRGHVDPEFVRWNTPLRTITDAGSALESMRAKAADVASGAGMAFCVTDAENGTILGSVAVNAIDRIQSSGVVGYWILPEARGRQVATRSLLLTARWAFDEVGLHRLELGHALGHGASCRVAERCGFPYEGTLRGAMWEAGRRDAYRDVHRHGRLATDPEPEFP